MKGGDAFTWSKERRCSCPVEVFVPPPVDIIPLRWRKIGILTVFHLSFPVGAEADDERIEFLLKELEGKDITEVIALGREKFASVPSGGGGGGGGGAVSSAGGGGGGAAEAKEEEKKEEKKEEEEEEDEVRVPETYILGLFCFGSMVY